MVAAAKQSTASAAVQDARGKPSEAATALAAIAAMLKAGQAPQALSAWQTFHAAYPDYPVPAELKMQIDLLRP